jgi:PIN domain nuclease of toxin-antitoxin system
MKYLFDTCTLLWYFTIPDKIHTEIYNELLACPLSDINVSVISLWEIAIKTSNGRTDFPGGVNAFIDYIKNSGVTLVNIKDEYTKVVETLPFIHKEPFDRMLIATAKVEDMTLITADEKIHQYNVKTLWK